MSFYTHYVSIGYKGCGDTPEYLVHNPTYWDDYYGSQVAKVYSFEDAITVAQALAEKYKQETERFILALANEHDSHCDCSS